MGVIQHDIVVATTWFPNDIENIKKQDFFDKDKFLISKPQMNGIYTVCLISDGSKEGWPDSESGDKLRQQFIAWMESCAYGDGSNRWIYAEVSMGEYGTEISQANRTENLYDGE